MVDGVFVLCVVFCMFYLSALCVCVCLFLIGVYSHFVQVLVALFYFCLFMYYVVDHYCNFSFASCRCMAWKNPNNIGKGNKKAIMLSGGLRTSRRPSSSPAWIVSKDVIFVRKHVTDIFPMKKIIFEPKSTPNQSLKVLGPPAVGGAKNRAKIQRWQGLCASCL